MWDINVQCDNVIESRRPDIIIIVNKERKAIIIQSAVPKKKKKWKSTRNWREMGRLQKLKMVVIVLVIIEALASATKNCHIVTCNVGVMQKAALLESVRILRKVLQMWRRDLSVSLCSFVMTRLTESMISMTTARTLFLITGNTTTSNK